MNRILIVDDVPQNSYLLEVLLQTNGYEVDKAANGIEALDVARKKQTDVIISDILMPGMDGFSLCRAVKADEQLKQIPFIFCTATYTDPRDEEFAISLGAERFIVKPVDGDSLLATLKEIIQNRAIKKPTAQQEGIETGDEFYKEYNETLIRKLEDKMAQLQKSNKRLISLYNISSDIHIMQPSANLIQIFLRTIIENAGYYHANYFSFDESQKKLTSLAAIGFPEETLSNLKDKLVFNLGEKIGLVGLVAQNEQIANIPDTSKEPNWLNLDPTIKSALFTPVHFEKKLLGVIGLFSKEQNAFTEEDEYDVAVLSNNLALAIENINNQEQVKKQLARLSALHSIDKAIIGSSDLNFTLNILLDHVTALLKIDAADVLLSQINVPTNKFIAGRGFNTLRVENDIIRVGNSLDKKVAEERRIIHVTELADQEVSPEFVMMWAKEGFSTYFGVPLIAKDKMVGILEIYHRTPLDPDPDWINYFETLAGQAAIAIDKAALVSELQASNQQLIQAYDATIEGWSRAMDLRDKETEGHTQRVTEMTLKLARAMGMSAEQLIQVKRGALLHDIGKLGIPDHILLKPETLSDEEWIIMRRHPQFAYDMLRPIEYLNRAIAIPYCHHEKWDGSGYPCGLKGEEIPLEARLFAVVDVWDALASDRPYRPALEKQKVLTYIQEKSGTQFDPKVVELFIKLVGN
jgi:response regulator RpfG family c-di-GMP phosphodiesterase